MAKKKYTFIDLFAGIGGFHIAMHYVGGKCVFASELDKNARLSYEANYKDIEPNSLKKAGMESICILMKISMMQSQARFLILIFVVVVFLANPFL